MLITPNRRASTPWPAVSVTVALACTFVYFLFLRPGPAEPAAPPPASAAPAKAEIVLQAPLAPEPRKVVPPQAAPVSYTPPPARSTGSEVDDLIASGKWRDARARLAARFSGAIPDAERAALAESGIRISRELLQNGSDPRDVEIYEIRQGDTLDGIARKFRTLNGVKGSILYVNNYRENAILRAGRKVRIAKGTWSMLVDKSLFRLWVLHEGCPFKGYTITIGAAASETPVAKYEVGVRNPKPAWWPPAELKIKGPIAYGDSQNPLGEWWVSLEHDLHHGIGIHGTNDPGAMGTQASNGCVRMLNEEVGEVAAVAYKGMSVEIVE